MRIELDVLVSRLACVFLCDRKKRATRAQLSSTDRHMDILPPPYSSTRRRTPPPPVTNTGSADPRHAMIKLKSMVGGGGGGGAAVKPTNILELTTNLRNPGLARINELKSIRKAALQRTLAKLQINIKRREQGLAPVPETVSFSERMQTSKKKGWKGRLSAMGDMYKAKRAEMKTKQEAEFEKKMAAKEAQKEALEKAKEEKAAAKASAKAKKRAEKAAIIERSKMFKQLRDAKKKAEQRVKKAKAARDPEKTKEAEEQFNEAKEALVEAERIEEERREKEGLDKMKKEEEKVLEQPARKTAKQIRLEAIAAAKLEEENRKREEMEALRAKWPVIKGVHSVPGAFASGSRLDQERWDDFLADQQKIIKLEANDYWAHYNLAIAFHARDAFEKAIPHYQAALFARPGDMELRQKLGSLLLKREARDQLLADSAAHTSTTALDPVDAQSLPSVAQSTLGDADNTNAPHKKPSGISALGMFGKKKKKPLFSFAAAATKNKTADRLVLPDIASKPPKLISITTGADQFQGIVNEDESKKKEALKKERARAYQEQLAVEQIKQNKQKLPPASFEKVDDAVGEKAGDEVKQQLLVIVAPEEGASENVVEEGTAETEEAPRSVDEDEEDSQTEVVDYSAPTAVAHFELGVQCEDRHEDEAAIAHYRAALECNQELHEARANLGICLFNKATGDYREYTVEHMLAGTGVFHPDNPPLQDEVLLEEVRHHYEVLGMAGFTVPPAIEFVLRREVLERRRREEAEAVKKKIAEREAKRKRGE